MREAHTAFYNMLVEQEIKFWWNNPDTYTKSEFDFICNRRGFNDDERTLIVKTLSINGLEMLNQ
jgi:hypothetical protein